MLNVFALVLLLVGAFTLCSLALRWMLPLTLARFWPRRNNPNEFVVRGTFRESSTPPRQGRSALIA